MSHVFISYSRTNKSYAYKLADYLIKQGFDVWIDNRINFGQVWLDEINKAIRNCAAFLVVMSPEALDSRYVQLEVQWALEQDKPIFPLLLSGDQWDILSHIHYADVSDKTLPGPKFLSDLARYAPCHYVPLDTDSEAKTLKRPSTNTTQQHLFSTLPPAQIWELPAPRQSHAAAVRDLAPLGTRYVVSASEDYSLFVWDIQTMRVHTKLIGHDGEVYSVAQLTGRHIVSGSRDQTLIIWDLLTRRVHKTLHGHRDAIFSVAVRNPSRIISASRDRTLRVWDVQNEETLHILSKHKDWVRDVAILGAHHVISASDDTTLRVWNIEKGTTSHILSAHESTVNAVAALDARHVISASDDWTLRLWNVWRERPLGILGEHTDTVSDVAILDVGRVVSASWDHTLRVWDIGTGAQLAVFRANYPLLCCTVMPDRYTIVAGDTAGRVHFLHYEE